MAEPKQGDKVEWNTSQAGTTGIVEEKLTSDTKIKGQRIKASKDDPKFKVRSDKTGAEAAHKPDALKPKGLGSRQPPGRRPRPPRPQNARRPNPGCWGRPEREGNRRPDEVLAAVHSLSPGRRPHEVLAGVRRLPPGTARAAESVAAGPRARAVRRPGRGRGRGRRWSRGGR